MDRATAISRIEVIDGIISVGATRGVISDRVVEYDLRALAAERSRLYSFLQGGRVRVGRYNVNVIP